MDNSDNMDAFRTSQGAFFCTKCGAEILNHNMNYCPSCGNKFNTQSINNNVEQMSIQNLNNLQNDSISKENNKRDNSVFLVLSIVNLFGGIPLVALVFFVALLGAAFGDEFSSYLLMLNCCGYFFASVVGVFVFTRNWDLKKSFLVIFISFLIGFIIPIVLHMF